MRPRPAVFATGNGRTVGSLSRPAPAVSLPARARPGDDAGALRLSAALMISSLILQRFGAQIGTSYLDIVAPVGMTIAGLGVATGVLVFHRRRTILFGLMLFLVLVSAVTWVAVRNEYGGAASLPSFGQFILLNSFSMLTFARPVSEPAFFRVVNNAIAIVAVAGLIEFFIQFIGIQAFTFKGAVPDSVLVESFWNVVIPIGGTYYYKANGFFLLEPSLFSQYTALGLLIEILLLRRAVFICLFAAGLISSVSGTGWLMIVGFVLTAIFSLGGRGVVLGLATASTGALALLGLSLASPDIYQFFVGRIDEFKEPGSSGHLRFITPWWFASDVLNSSPLATLLGIGAGISEHPGRTPSYDYSVNSIVKLLLEYGAPTLILFLALLLTNRRTRTQTALIAPILVWVLSDGGNIQMAFVLLPALLLIATADLRTAAPA